MFTKIKNTILHGYYTLRGIKTPAHLLQYVQDNSVKPPEDIRSRLEATLHEHPELEPYIMVNGEYDLSQLDKLSEIIETYYGKNQYGGLYNTAKWADRIDLAASGLEVILSILTQGASEVIPIAELIESIPKMGLAIYAGHKLDNYSLTGKLLLWETLSFIPIIGDLIIDPLPLYMHNIGKEIRNQAVDEYVNEIMNQPYTTMTAEPIFENFDMSTPYDTINQSIPLYEPIPMEPAYIL